MNLFGLFSRSSINQGAEEYRNTPGAILLDVRSKDEYAGGHIAGSINIPVDKITEAEKIIKDHNTHIFVYCLRGSRSLRAAGILRNIGYKNVKSIGGITGYKGELEK